MAITHVGTDTEATADNAASISRSYTVPAGSNRLLIAHYTGEDGTADDAVLSTVVWNTTESLTKADAAGTNSRSEVWYLLNPTATTSNVVFTPASTTSGLAVAVSSYAGVAQSSQPDNTATATGSGDDPVNTITPVANNTLIVDVFNYSTSFNTLQSSDAAQTDVSILKNDGAHWIGASYIILVGGASSAQNVGWNTSAAATWSHTMATFSEAGAAAATTPSMNLLGVGT